jgi:hypothetical protein
MRKHLTFVPLEVPKNITTKAWTVKSDTAYMGSVVFYPQWRAYVFTPQKHNDTIWSFDCLEELAGFLREQNSLYKIELASRKTRARAA